MVIQGKRRLKGQLHVHVGRRAKETAGNKKPEETECKTSCVDPSMMRWNAALVVAVVLSQSRWKAAVDATIEFCFADALLRLVGEARRFAFRRRKQRSEAEKGYVRKVDSLAEGATSDRSSHDEDG